MITIICGTNRKNSISKIISQIYSNILKEKEHETQFIYLEDLPDTFITTALYENAGKDEVFNTFRNTMKNANKMVFIVPEYNGSFPGVMKAFIDGLIFPDTFMDKKCALVGVSSGVQGAGLALSHLTDIFNYCGMNVLAQKPKLSRIEENLSESKLGELYHSLLVEQAEKLVAY